MNIEKLSRFDRVMVTMSASPVAFVMCGIEACCAFGSVVNGSFWWAAAGIVFMCLFWQMGVKRLAGEYRSAGNMAVSRFAYDLKQKSDEFFSQHPEMIVRLNGENNGRTGT